MKTPEELSNKAIQKEIGIRLQRERLNQNITQVQLSERVGISRRTLVAAEKGEGTTLETLIRILRGLDRIGQLDRFLPDPGLSPIQVAKLKGKVRKKATGKFQYPTHHDTGWTWIEDG